MSTTQIVTACKGEMQGARILGVRKQFLESKETAEVPKSDCIEGWNVE